MFTARVWILVIFWITCQLAGGAHVIEKRDDWHDEGSLYWKMNCDFTDNNFTNVQIPGEQCGGACFDNPACTHFAWTTYNGGTCWLKQNQLTLDQAIYNDSPGSVCGALKRGVAPPSSGCPAGWYLIKTFDFSSRGKVDQEWNVLTWPPGFVNHEMQSYVTSGRNVFTRNNNLILKAFRDGNSYTSGRVESREKFSPFKTSGKKLRVEFTGKVPTVPGAFPAFWLLGDDNTYGAWPYSGEIDIMEWVHQISGKSQATIHWTTTRDAYRQFNLSPQEMANTLMTYGVEYSAVPNNEYIDYYIRYPNGQVVTAQRLTRDVWSDFSKCPGGRVPGRFPCSPLAPFDNNMRLIINLAVGGWGGAGVTDYSAFYGGVELETSRAVVCGKQ